MLMPVPVHGRRKSRGFTLVELLIGMALSLLVAGAVISIFVTTTASNAEHLAILRLSQDMRVTMDFMTRDLRRTAYWSNAAWAAYPNSELVLSAVSGAATATASSGAPFSVFNSAGDITQLKIVGLNGKADITGYTNGAEVSLNIASPFDHDEVPAESWRILNPFDLASNPQLEDTDGDGIEDCILYQYDVDGNNKIDAGEQFGFRYNDTKKTIERYQSNNYDCTGGNWEAITDPNTTLITGLELSLINRVIDLDGSGIGTSTITLRDINIVLDGESVQTDHQQTLNETIRLRNDHYTP